MPSDDIDYAKLAKAFGVEDPNFDMKAALRDPSLFSLLKDSTAKVEPITYKPIEHVGGQYQQAINQAQAPDANRYGSLNYLKPQAEVVNNAMAAQRPQVAAPPQMQYQDWSAAGQQPGAAGPQSRDFQGRWSR